jgi:hypothetical protein
MYIERVGLLVDRFSPSSSLDRTNYISFPHDLDKLGVVFLTPEPRSHAAGVWYQQATCTGSWQGRRKDKPCHGTKDCLKSGSHPCTAEITARKTRAGGFVQSEAVCTGRRLSPTSRPVPIMDVAATAKCPRGTRSRCWACEVGCGSPPHGACRLSCVSVGVGLAQRPQRRDGEPGGLRGGEGRDRG